MTPNRRVRLVSTCSRNPRILSGPLVGEVAHYEDLYRLCYLRGPEGIIVALAEQLR
jgi:hypothetical protein